MKARSYEFSTLAGGQVDKEEGIISGVSIITSGVKAKGHNLEVDKTTLTQMLSCAESKGKVPVKWNHKTGADAVSGFLKNFRIKGKKLLADWHLLKNHERYDHAMELAERMPEGVGLSAAFRGEDEELGDKTFARCSELVSVDLVSSPAANPDGMFSEGGVDSPARGMATPTDPTDQPSLADVLRGLSELTTAVKGFDDRIGDLEKFNKAFSEALEDEDEEEQEEDPEGGEDTEFESAGEMMTYLSERLDAIQGEQEKKESDHAFAVIEGNVTRLISFNEQLVEENRAMAGVIKELSAKAGAKVEFSAGADGGVIGKVTTGKRGRQLTEFEARVEELVTAGKTKSEAINVAVGEDPDRYETHLESIGAKVKTLG